MAAGDCMSDLAKAWLKSVWLEHQGVIIGFVLLVVVLVVFL